MEMFRSNVSEQQYQTWFSPMRVKQYDAAKKELTVFTPSQFFFEYLEEHYRRLIHITISRFFGEDVALYYQVEVADNVTVSQESDGNMVVEPAPSVFAANQSPTLAQAVGMAEDLDSQLNVHQTFANFIEGTSNKLPRSVGQAIAEHPEQMTFNPLFIYVASEVLAIVLGHLGVSGVVFDGIHAVIPAAKVASLTYAVYFVLLNFVLGYILYRRNIYIKL